MGVSNLLKELQPLVEKPTSAEATLQRFKGEKLAVDLSSWLYKGAYGCALELGMGRPTNMYVAVVLRRLHTLRHHGVEAVLVCDNGATGLKAETQASRRSDVERKKAEEVARRRRGRWDWRAAATRRRAPGRRAATPEAAPQTATRGAACTWCRSTTAWHR